MINKDRIKKYKIKISKIKGASCAFYFMFKQKVWCNKKDTESQPRYQKGDIVRKKLISRIKSLGFVELQNEFDKISFLNLLCLYYTLLRVIID